MATATSTLASTSDTEVDIESTITPVEPTVARDSSTEPLPKTTKDKLTQANLLKEKGTFHFKKREWKAAVKSYHHAAMYTKGIISSSQFSDPLMKTIMSSRSQENVSDEEKREAKALNITLLNNIALCMLKQQQWSRVIKHASEVLNYDSDNVKALYRRGVAYLNTRQYDESERDLKMALQLDPTDSSIKKQYAALQEQLKIYWKNEQKKYKGMFNKSDDNLSTDL